MLTKDIQSQSLPFLRLHDKVYQALLMMSENHVTHLPIMDGQKFAGIISENDLLQVENDKSELSQLHQSFGSQIVQICRRIE